MFLGQLLQRALGETPGIAPRRASRFEPDAGAPEPAIVESVETAPTPAILPLTPAPQAPAEPPGRIETRLMERAVEPPEPGPHPPRPAAIATDRPAEPQPVRRAPAREPHPEPLAPRREPAPAVAPQQSRVAPAPPPPIERHTETIVRETAETRVESRTIERRLESLVRQIERTEEFRTTLLTPAGPLPAPAAAPPHGPAPRTVIVPAETTRSAPRQPVLLEAPPGVPVAPAVHVTIGRVEVRAAAQPSAHQKPRPREPRLNLEDYLRHREGA